MMKSLRASLGVLSLLLMLPLVVHAQSTLFFTRELALTLSPEFPGPGETVRLTIESYALDLDRSFVTWEANGTVIAAGTGVREVTLTAGEMGSMTEINVEAHDGADNAGSARATVRPAEIDLLWSTDSYAPPFFKGRKLAGTSPTVEAYALVRFKEEGDWVREDDIVYTWRRNGTVMESISGRGKARAVFAGPARGTEKINVAAETLDHSQRIEASINITAHDPELRLFEEHPLFGTLFHRAIVGVVNTIERELHVTVVPFFARTSDPSTLTYDWSVNEVSVTANSEDPETLVITAGDYSGPVTIALTAMNPNDILMRSRGMWKLIFGGSGGVFSGVNPFGN